MITPEKGMRHNRWAFPLIFMVVSAIGILSTAYVGVAVHESRKLGMFDRVGTIAQAIDPAEVKALSGTEADLENPAYLDLKDLVTSMRAANHDVEFVYLNGRRGGEVFFLVDSEDPESEDYSPPGQPYDEASGLMHGMFETGELGFEIERDRWGYWVSALAPVFDPETGDVLALVGIDVPANDYFLDIAAYCLIVVLLTTILLSLMIGVQFVRNRERMYVDQRSEFLSVAAHEIRTPLTGIRWATENLLTGKKAKLDPYAERLVSLVHESGITAIGRINNLLNITAYESGGMTHLRFEDLELRPLVDEVVKSLSLAASVRTVTIAIDGSVAPGLKVHGDREALRHILSNLVSNAVKYTSAGTEVGISFARGAGEDVVSVRDFGIGIPPEEIERIFDGYHRTEAARRLHEHGTGMGLYLVQKLAKLHGGTIAVESAEGEGSTFSLRLKRKQ